MNTAALYRLMTWLSPSYPVGSFSYSQGLETAVAQSGVHDRETLEHWISATLRFGPGCSDAILFRQAHGAICADDAAAVEEVRQVALAVQPAAELRRQTELQGAAFIEATQSAWPCPAILALASAGQPVPFPLAVAAACAGHDIDVDAGLTAFLTEASANLVSAGMRLIPLGQRDGQLVIAALEDVISETVHRTRGLTLDDIGTATPIIDLAAIHHETLYTRLFRS